MEKIINYTGAGDDKPKRNKWPHPMNDNFNEIIKNTVNIYGIGPKKDADLLKKCKEYLHSRISGLIEHKIKRETEKYYQAMNLEITHGIGKREDEQQMLIQNTSLVMCVGDWSEDEECMKQYRIASMYSKPVYEMRYEYQIPLEKTIRYLQPVRPIEDTTWDYNKQDDLLLFESDEGLLEVIDGNHRHEFANRVGGVKHVSGWIIKEV